MPKISINITDMLTFSRDTGWQRTRLATDTVFGYNASIGCRAVAYRFVCPQYSGNAKKAMIGIPVYFPANKLSAQHFNLSVTDTLPTQTAAYNSRVLGEDAGRVGTIRATISGAGLVEELFEVPVTNLVPGNDYFVILSANEDSSMTVRTNTVGCSMFYFPRPSTIIIPMNKRFCLGDEILISINRHSSDVGHRVTYTFGDDTGVILDGDIEPNSVAWTPPLALGNQAPNAMVGQCSIACETILDGETVGVTAITFSLYMPSTKFAPTVMINRVAPVSENTVVSGWNAYVQGYSRVQVGVATAALYGAGIADCEITIKGVGTYNGSYITSDIINISGTIQISCTVTDTRGQTATAVSQIYVYPYTRPSLSNIVCHRSDESGRYDKDGANYYAQATAKYSSIGGRNAYVIESRFKTVDGEYSDPGLLTSGVGAVCGGRLLSPYRTYIAQILIRDSLNSTPYTITIPNERDTFKIKDGGRGIGIGTIPTEDDLLDVGFDARFQAGVKISGEYPKLVFSVGNIVVGEIGSYSDGPTIGNMFIRVYDASGKYKEYTWSAS